jgi:hypothetical protein
MTKAGRLQNKLFFGPGHLQGYFIFVQFNTTFTHFIFIIDGDSRIHLNRINMQKLTFYRAEALIDFWFWAGGGKNTTFHHFERSE